MEEKYDYVIDNNGLLANDDVFKLEKGSHIERKIFLFVDTNFIGLSFPDLTSISLMNEYHPGCEKFITKKDLIIECNWDSTINYPNRTIRINMTDGIVIARTIMISQNKMDEIRKKIKNTKNDENIEINLKNN